MARKRRNRRQVQGLAQQPLKPRSTAKPVRAQITAPKTATRFQARTLDVPRPWKSRALAIIRRFKPDTTVPAPARRLGAPLPASGPLRPLDAATLLRPLPDSAQAQHKQVKAQPRGHANPMLHSEQRPNTCKERPQPGPKKRGPGGKNWVPWCNRK